MAGDSTGEGELLEQFSNPFFILLHVCIKLAIGAFQVGVRDHGRPPVTGAANIDHVQVIFPDETVEMDINKVQSRTCTPMSRQPWFDVLELEWLAQQGI